jgi:hypothetical protein
MVAITTVNRSSGARLEGNLGFFTAFGAGNCVHLPGRGRYEGSKKVFIFGLSGFAGSPCGAAGSTALRRMIMSFSAKSLLFFNCEDISIAAIMTG